MEITPFETSMLFDANFNVPEHIDLAVNQGGTSSTKTYSIAQVILMTAYVDHESLTTVAGQDIPNLKSGVMRDFQEIISNSLFCMQIIKEYNKTDRIYTLHNGSKIEFKAYEDEQDAKNGKRDYLFCNEVNGISHAIFDTLFVRTKKLTWVDYNPTGEFWINHKGLLNRKGTRVIKSTFLHNPFIDEKTRNKILGYKETDPYRWKVYGLGEVAQLEGAILRNWTPGEFDESIPYIYGLDFGFSPDPCALSKVAIGDQKIYVEEKAYLNNLSTDQIKELLREYTKEDDLIVADCAEKRLINDLITAGHNVNACVKGKDSIKKGLKDMQDYQIIVCGDSPNLRMELNNYVWNDKKAGIPIDKYNHIIDGVRYAFDRLNNPIRKPMIRH